MSEWKRKRFWAEISVRPDGPGFEVFLDERPLRTPAKAQLSLPTRKLAQKVAEEWDAQQGEIDPSSMPFTRMANAAIDKVRMQKAEVAEMLAAYGDSDLLCYRAASPAELVARQAESWDPPLDWAARALGARLQTQIGVVHRPQPPEQLERLAARVHALGEFQLAAFHDIVSLSGSLVLGLAVTDGWCDAETAWKLSRIDETWQEEQWGVDDEARKTAEIKRFAFLHAAEFFSLS